MCFDSKSSVLTVTPPSRLVSQLKNLAVFWLLLSALHYRENADWKQAVDNRGEPVYSICYPKAKKGDYTVRPTSQLFRSCSHINFLVIN